MSRKATYRPATSWLLVLLALLFLGAGMSRLGLGVVEVIAAEPEPDGIAAAPPPLAPDPGDLLAALRAREARIEQTEAELQARSEALRAAEAELERQIETLIATETRLAATLRLTESAAEDDLQRLTTVFEHMKPAQAAELFSQMDTEFAAGFMARLRPDFAGEVMAGLEPVIAYAISAVLAGRHARTPRN
ncbi:MotE family protein [Natronohydrobacter thiooxidans]|uniref:MotE family protein n=1 Tax=Natronohydrobacter thiooxidans TaxID=87172 RepID=UPI0008FF2445|nr:hypothetical protein [Natronohydrobacter thiooxidans]